MRRRLVTAAVLLVAAGCTGSAAPTTTTSPAAGAAPTTATAPSTTAAPPTTPAPPATAAPTTTPPPTSSTTTTTVVLPPSPGPEPPPPEPGEPLPAGSTGVALVGAGGAGLAAAVGGEPYLRAREGLVFPVEGRTGDWLRILTNCHDGAWVSGSEVRFTPTRPPPPPAGPGFDLTAAVVVIDPGHGGDNTGAIGPGGLVEKHVNLDIARRARDLLVDGRDVDWATGAVTPGTAYPPFGTVWLTRAEGPPGADIDTGLTFRAHLANLARADALVSIHNNASPDGPFDGPGSEAFYRVADAESRRLAGIMVEELRLSLGRFTADWVGDTDAGAKYRTRLDDPSRDYYGLLRAAAVPTVLAEGAFISNPSEEALLATAAFRQAYAEAVYRALVRFLTTDDPGSGYTEPYRREVPAGSGAPRPTCHVPEQP